MTIDYSALAIPKPEPRTRTKARKDRLEDRVAKAVRLKVEARDGYCRFEGIGPCQGVSEWAHIGDYERSKTRGQAPERRHTTFGSLMACNRHHLAIHGHVRPRLWVDLGERGCDGPIVARWGTVRRVVPVRREMLDGAQDRHAEERRCPLLRARAEDGRGLPRQRD